MNYRELSVAEKYRSEGWKPLRNGAPDFVMLKTDECGQIEEMLAVEVKATGDDLTYEQKVWREICRRAGIPFKVEVVE